MTIRTTLRLALSLAALTFASACRSPVADAAIAQQMQQLADELNGIRQDAAVAHEQVDSMRVVLARQDTLIRQLANLAGVQVPAR